MLLQGNDSVVECDSLNGNVMVQVSYNPPETDPMPASNRNKMLDTVSTHGKVSRM